MPPGATLGFSPSVVPPSVELPLDEPVAPEELPLDEPVAPEELPLLLPLDEPLLEELLPLDEPLPEEPLLDELVPPDEPPLDEPLPEELPLEEPLPEELPPDPSPPPPSPPPQATPRQRQPTDTYDSRREAMDIVTSTICSKRARAATSAFALVFPRTRARTVARGTIDRNTGPSGVAALRNGAARHAAPLTAR